MVFGLFYFMFLFCSLLISIDHDEKAYKRLVEQVEAADEIISDKDKTINQLEQKLLTQVEEEEKNRRRKKYTAKMPYNIFICLYIFRRIKGREQRLGVGRLSKKWSP